MAILGIAWLFFIVILGSIALLGTIFGIWMLVDCATNEPSEGNDKIIWILVNLLTHLIGALIYFFVRRPTRKTLLGH
jgi:hypothetical protein